MRLRLRRRFWLGFGILTLACILLGFGAYLFPERFLTVDSGPVKADVLVVLGGRPDRAGRAAELFKEGAAPKVLVSGSGDWTSNKRLLEKEGVPATAIVVEPKSRTTLENAKLSIPLLRQMGAHKVIIVTSWYHSRRGLMCFEHYAPDIQFYSRPSYYGYRGRPADETKRAADKGPSPDPIRNPAIAKRADAFHRAELKQVQHYAHYEYFKLAGYWVCYGVWPF